MVTTKRQNDLNIMTLEEVIGKCDFKGTATVFSRTLRELIESYNEMEINGDEYSQYMNKATKMLDDNKCNCTKMK